MTVRGGQSPRHMRTAIDTETNPKEYEHKRKTASNGKEKDNVDGKKNPVPVENCPVVIKLRDLVIDGGKILL